MPIVLLVRHGRSTANTAGTLAGRLPGIELDEIGRGQVARTAERLGSVRLAEVLSSPLRRCRQTADAIAARHDLTPRIKDDLTECGYGDWEGRPLRELAAEPLWRSVQERPSTVVFPGGESMTAMQARAVDAIRDHDARIGESHGDHAVWVAVSHGDVIKAVLADALGLHLDRFQRLHVDPASVSIVHYGPQRPDVLAVNTAAGDLGWLASPPDPTTQVGGGAGPGRPS